MRVVVSALFMVADTVTSTSTRVTSRRGPVEAEIVCRESGVDKDVATKLVKIADKIRRLTSLRLAETVSTRLLVDAGCLIRSGLPKRVAVDAGILQPLTDDGDTLAALRDVATLMM